MPEPPYTNQRQFPTFGTGISVDQFRRQMEPWISAASDVIEGTQIITAAQNALTTPQEQRDALIWARAAGNLSTAGDREVAAKINELNGFIHRIEGGIMGQ